MMIPKQLHIARCSALFAILANVDNCSSVPYEPIALPRGIPSDASQETMNWFNAWDEDAFAASWLTLKEIDAFDWNREVQDNFGWRATYAELAGFNSFREKLTPYEHYEMARFIFWFNR